MLKKILPLTSLIMFLVTSAKAQTVLPLHEIFSHERELFLQVGFGGFFGHKMVVVMSDE